MSVESVILCAIGMMGAVGLFLLNGIRADISELWKGHNSHCSDRLLHTHCGKETHL
jgi:hypothetical protein